MYYDVNKYPIEHTFGWFKIIIPLYIRQLNSECASIIHKYLSND